MDGLSLFEERVIGGRGPGIDGLDAEIGALYAQRMSSSGISRCLSAKSGIEASEKLVLAIVNGSYGKAARFDSRKVPKRPSVYLAELGPFSFYRFHLAVWRPLYTSEAVEAERHDRSGKKAGRLRRTDG